jgi:hypothetical protein
MKKQVNLAFRFAVPEEYGGNEIDCINNDYLRIIFLGGNGSLSTAFGAHTGWYTITVVRDKKNHKIQFRISFWRMDEALTV